MPMLRAVGVVAPLPIDTTLSKLDERVGVCPGESKYPKLGLVDRNSSTLDAECERWMASDCGCGGVSSRNESLAPV